MRKLLIMLVCFTAWSGSVPAKSLPIRIYVQDVDGKPSAPDRQKAPMRMPIIYLEGYTLSLSSFHPEYIINIVQDDVVVYSSLIPEGVTEYDLPSYLEGEYLIQFVSESNCFTGYIIL